MASIGSSHLLWGNGLGIIPNEKASTIQHIQNQKGKKMQYFKNYVWEPYFSLVLWIENGVLANFTV